MRDERRRAPGRSRGCAVAAAAALAAAVSPTPVVAEPVTATWKSASSGNWIDGARWSTDPAFPNNGVPAGVTYHAVINASGVGYTVTVGQDIAVDDVLLDAPNGASVAQVGGTFSTGTGIEIRRGLWRVSGTGRLDSDVRVVGPSAGLMFENSLPFDRAISLVDNATLSFAADQTFSGTAEVAFDSALQDRRAGVIRGANLTIGTGVSIRTGSGDGVVGWTTDALTNRGLISASGGSFVRVIGNALVNQGTLEALDGGRLILEPLGASGNGATIRASSGGTIVFSSGGGTWSNTGKFHLAGGSSLVLAGAVSPMLTAGLTREENSNVIVAGRVENAGSTLSLDAFGGRWALGSVAFPSSTGDIRGGNLGSPGEAGTLSVVGESALSGVTNHANIEVRPGVTLTLQGSTTNHGSISANDARVVVFGTPVKLGAMSLTDSTLQLGTTYLPASGTSANVTTGQLSQVDLTRSRILVAKGATVDNSGSTITVRPGGAWQLAGGTINNGAIAIADGAVFGTSTDGAADGAAPQNSFLDNVAVTGTLTLDNSGVTLRNGSTWTGDRIQINATAATTTRAPALVFANSVTLDRPIEVSFHGAAARAVVGGTSGTFTLDSEITVRNETGLVQRLTLGDTPAAVVNRGELSIEGVTVTLQGNAISNEGLIEVRGAGSSLVLGRAPTNYAVRKLTGGRWHVYDGGTMQLTFGFVDRIETNAAEVVVSGATSTLWNFPFMNLSRNEGSLSVLDGHVLNVGAVTNVSEMKVGRGSVVTTSGKLDSTAGKFDTDGLVVVTGTEATRAGLLHDVTEQIRTGRNAPEGQWKGSTGITSSAAAANPLTGLAAVINDNGSGSAIVTRPYGMVTPDANSIIIMYTYNGDANIDGRINADDYFRIDQGFLAQPSEPTWRDGDFNYDGRVNADDYFLIDQAFLGQGERIGGAAALAAVPVPEPAGAGMLCVGSLLMRRRRR